VLLYRRQAEARIEIFRAEFAQRLPESFPNLELYLRCRYGLMHRPVFRAPRDRHTLFVLGSVGRRASEQDNTLRRMSESIDRGYKNEFVAALTAPFDHIPDIQEANRHVQTLLVELDRLDDEDFANFLKHVAPSLNRLIWEKVTWWSATSLPDLAIRYLTFIIAILFFTQTILHITVVRGRSADWLPAPVGVASNYQIVLILSVTLLLALAARREGALGLLRRAAIVTGLALLLPLYVAGIVIVGFLRAIGSVLGDILEIGGPSNRPYDPPWPFRSTLAMAAAIVGLGLCTATIVMVESPRYVAPATVGFLVVLWVLLVWLYYWNFRPLQLLELGIRAYVFLYTLGIEKDPKRIRERLERERDRPRRPPELIKLHVAIEHCKNLRRRSSRWRLLVHAANTFVGILAATFALLVSGYGLVFWGVTKAWSGVIVTAAEGRDLGSLSESLRASLNNLPIGGSALATAAGLPGELLLFSERVGAVLVLVVALFGYSTIAASEVVRGSVRFRMNVRALQHDLEASVAAYNEAEMEQAKLFASGSGSDDPGGGGSDDPGAGDAKCDR